HEVAVAGARNQRFRRGRLTSGIEGGPWPPHLLGLENRILDAVVFAGKAEARLRPQTIDDRQPIVRARVARIVGVELDPVLLRFLGHPPDTGNQYPKRIGGSPLAESRRAARMGRSPRHAAHRRRSWTTR